MIQDKWVICVFVDAWYFLDSHSIQSESIFHKSNDNRRINKIIDQRQIRSVSSRFRNKIRLATSNHIESRDCDESTNCESLFQRSHHFFYNLRSLLNVAFACKKRVWRKKIFLYKKKQKTSFEFFRSIFERDENEKSFANYVLCENVAIRQYKSMIAIKSRDVIKMIKMIVSRDD